MHTPHRLRFRALLSAACCAVLGAGLLAGIGFHGRGWSGVTQAAPGGTATGPAVGTYEQGIDDYKAVDQVPGDDGDQDDVREPAGPRRHLLLRAERRHHQR
ncbi:hypothetical protein EDD90_8728 [Streptomyces sp. Ag109_O5-1]|nr:hypothetical protein EDD90_8728 [Streptomyces sp. Ag109_O5-1]